MDEPVSAVEVKLPLKPWELALDWLMVLLLGLGLPESWTKCESGSDE